MYRLPSEEKAHKEEIGALILSIIIIIAGIGGMIYTKRLSWEYKNSTDVRTMDALVYSCKQCLQKSANILTARLQAQTRIVTGGSQKSHCFLR